MDGYSRKFVVRKKTTVKIVSIEMKIVGSKPVE
jgi:hypothetical protein